MSEPADVKPASRPAAGRPAHRRRTEERLVALLVVGTVLLNFPLLSVLHGREAVAGIPALFIYLFAVWALLAGATALVLRRRPVGPERRGDDPGSRGR